MNIDFSTRPGFSAYVLLLMFSGVAMVILASPAVKRQDGLQRVLNAAFGVGFFGYGFYLAFVFHGGSYIIFFKAFILPVLLIARTLRGTATRSPKQSDSGAHTQFAYPAASPAMYPATYPVAGPPAPSHPVPPPFGSPSMAQPDDDGAGWLSTPVLNGQPAKKLPTQQDSQL